MASVDNLPGDQRAVLELVLGQGRSYATIGSLLAIDPDEVRRRAHAALDALGPPTQVAAADRALVSDYLLGQLSSGELELTQNQLAQDPAQRAWARVLAGELTPLAARPLPNLPDGKSAPAPAAADPGPPTAALTAPAPAVADPGPPTAALTAPAPAAADEDAAAVPSPSASPGPRSSRTGGIVLLGLLAAAIVAAVVVFVVIKPGSGHHHATTAASVTGASAAAATPASDPSSSTTTASTSATPVGQVNLRSPSGGKKPLGVGVELEQGSVKALAIVAQGLTPNTTKDAYAVWLYNSAGHSHLLGYPKTPVGKNGELQVETTALPSNASHYKQLIVTLESAQVTQPTGPVVLAADLTPIKGKL